MPLVALLTLALTACGGAAATRSSARPAASWGPVTLRLGYYATITHATPLVGVRKGTFAQALGSNVTLKTSIFNAGPAEVEALLSNSVDAAYIGPNPAINAFTRSHGEAVRVISGATSGGASLVVKPGITSAAGLRGKRLATPELGNTQDVALRWWLKAHGLKTDIQGGGDVSILPQENAQTLQTFRSGQIDGAWVPEPWATRLVQEGGGRVLVDERGEWKQTNGQFVTTELMVRTEFLQQHRDVVPKLLEAQVETTDFIDKQPIQAQQLAGQAIAEITGAKLSPAVVAAAWKNLTFTNDPIARSQQEDTAHAVALGLLPRTDLGGIYDLSLLNAVLEQRAQAPVSAA